MQDMWETQIRALGWEYLLEEDMATHPSILTWRIPWTEEPGRPESLGAKSWTWLKQSSKHARIHTYTK